MLILRQLVAFATVFSSVALIGACTSSPTTSPAIGEGDGARSSSPSNPLIEGDLPPVRVDTFYKTETKRGDKSEILNDRLISNGHGHVAYSVDPKMVDNGYYLYNFSGHTSYFVNLNDRTYKVALTSPGDDILRAYADGFNTHLTEKVKVPLPLRKIGKYDCRGFSYKNGDTTREEWFDNATFVLVEQSISRPGVKVKRSLTRANTFCETLLLRLPTGFTLIQ
ncbi:hypothetical protein BH11CYA1_BH11CYA1_30790 [soil metagenome]